MSELLRFLENEVQIAALLFMAAVYTVRLVWLFRFRSRKERTFAEGREAAGIGRSLLRIAAPGPGEAPHRDRVARVCGRHLLVEDLGPVEQPHRQRAFSLEQ
jgi:hypothetical protein